MARTRSLTDIAGWEAVWEAQEAPDAAALLIFKQSPVCPISRAAQRRFEAWLDALSPATARKLRVVAVDVIAHRPVSQRIEQDTGVKHESPQAILFGPGRRRRWHASHGDIHAGALDEALNQAS